MKKPFKVEVTVKFTTLVYNENEAGAAFEAGQFITRNPEIWALEKITVEHEDRQANTSSGDN